MESNSFDVNNSNEHLFSGVKQLTNRLNQPDQSNQNSSTPNGQGESSDILVKLNDDNDINGNDSQSVCSRNHQEHCSCFSSSLKQSPCDACHKEMCEKHVKNLKQSSPDSLCNERCSSPDPSSSFLHNRPVLAENVNRRKLSRVCSAPCLTRSWSSDENGEMSA